MKKLRILFIAGAIAALAVMLAACGAPALPKPENLAVNEQTLQLSWNEVEGAKSYVISFGGEERTTRRNSYSLSNLQPGTYGVKVRAVGDGDKHGDSGWSSEIMFVKAVESGLSYRLINSNTEYEVSGIGAASGDVVVDDTYRGKPVTRIGDSAFYNNGKLTSITIGNNVTEIGVRAFYNCSYLEQVVIPENVTKIGEYAFQSCRALTSITIPDSVTEIKDYTFSTCRALKEIDFGSGVTKIGNYAFASCAALESVVIPDTVTALGEYAFSDCASKDAEGNVISGLKSVGLGGVVTLSQYSFNRCTALEEIDFGASVEVISDYVFAECDALNNVVVPDNVKSIGAYAFYGCDALDTIKIGSGVESIGVSAFSGTKLWIDVAATPSTGNAATYGLVYADKWLVGNKDTSRTLIAIADGTVGIGAQALASMTAVNSVSLPDSLKYIGDYAFAGDTNLPNIVLNKTERVGDYAFYGCNNMTVWSFSDSLKSIGNYAFANCSHLNNPTTTFADTFERIGVYAFYNTDFWSKSPDVVYCSNWVVDFKDTSDTAVAVSLRGGTKGIADYAFYKKKTVNVITVPDSVQRIGVSAFRECSSLIGVKLPSGLKELSPYTFYKCYSLATVVFPDSLEKIGRSAFYNCCSLDEITIPDSVKEIGPYAFYNLALEFMGFLIGGTTKITLGSGLEKIGDYAFARAYLVTEMVIPDGVKELGAHAFDKCGFEKLTLGAGLEHISDYAFRGCAKLKELVLPDNIKSIGRYAFKDCVALEKLTIGGGMEYIGQYAFGACSALTGLAIPDNVKTIDNYAFYKCTKLASLNIGGYVDYVGRHAFYGNKAMTVYFEGESVPSDWNVYWNSSYRPVVFGAELSVDKTEVLSVTIKENGILNPDAVGGIVAPVKPLSGYDCAGWTTVSGGSVEIDADKLDEVEVGKKLYPVWAEHVEPAPEPEPETPSDTPEA